MTVITPIPLKDNEPIIWLLSSSDLHGPEQAPTQRVGMASSSWSNENYFSGQNKLDNRWNFKRAAPRGGRCRRNDTSEEPQFGLWFDNSRLRGRWGATSEPRNSLRTTSRYSFRRGLASRRDGGKRGYLWWRWWKWHLWGWHWWQWLRMQGCLVYTAWMDLCWTFYIVFQVSHVAIWENHASLNMPNERCLESKSYFKAKELTDLLAIPCQALRRNQSWYEVWSCQIVGTWQATREQVRKLQDKCEGLSSCNPEAESIHAVSWGTINLNTAYKNINGQKGVCERQASFLFYNLTFVVSIK